MKNQDTILSNFDNISRIYGAYHIGEEFIMIDNLDDELVPEDIDSVFVKYPIRITCNAVYFCVQGTLTVKINLHEYQISSNETLTILPGSIMEVVDSSFDVRIAVISFSNDYFSPIEHTETSMNISQIVSVNPKISLTEPLMRECIDIYLKMKEKLKQKDNPFRKFALKAYSYVLCAISFEQLVTKPIEKISNTDRPMSLYDQFIKLVQQNFRQHRTIQYYAEMLNITPKYFSVLIKKVSGKTAGEWIDEYVLLEARALLKSRQYTVQQVSDMLSFPNQSFFAKYFKAHTGLTPTQYQTSTD